MTTQNHSVERFLFKPYVDKRGRFAKHWSFIIPCAFHQDLAVKTKDVEYLILGKQLVNTAGYVKFHKQRFRDAIIALYPEASVYEYNFNVKYRINGIKKRDEWVGVGEGPGSWSRIKRLHAGYLC